MGCGSGLLEYCIEIKSNYSKVSRKLKLFGTHTLRERHCTVQECALDIQLFSSASKL